jgi:hypothetical protein
VRLPETEITLTDIYAALVIVAAYNGRLFRVTAAEWLAAMIEYGHYATVSSAVAQARDYWPDVLDAAGGQTRRAFFGVEGWAWKYAGLAPAMTFVVAYFLAPTRPAAVAAFFAAAVFFAAVVFFNLVRVRRKGGSPNASAGEGVR